MKDSREVGRLVRMDQGLTLATPTRLTPSLRPRFLVCAPDYFDAHFLFNPFMRHTDVVDRRRAKRQWGTFVCVLESAGAELEIMAAEPVTAALPFTADGAFFYAPGRAVVLRNDGGRGELEPPVFAAWLARHGYSTEPLPPRYRLDGGNLLRLETGDVLAGLKPGVEGLAERYLARLLRLGSGAALTTVRLADERFLHLDTVVGVLGGGRYLVYRGGLSGGRLPLADAEVVEVSEADALRFACNVVVVGNVVITGPISTELRGRIERLGFHVEPVDLSEFYKAGGGAKCLTLPLWPKPQEVAYGT